MTGEASAAPAPVQPLVGRRSDTALIIKNYLKICWITCTRLLVVAPVQERNITVLGCYNCDSLVLIIDELRGGLMTRSTQIS